MQIAGWIAGVLIVLLYLIADQADRGVRRRKERRETAWRK